MADKEGKPLFMLINIQIDTRGSKGVDAYEKLDC